VTDRHRANGIEFSIIAPTIIVANVTFATTSSLIDNRPDQVAAIAAVRAYINKLPVGAALQWTRLYQVAYDASPTITGITNLLVNGGTADIAAPLPNVIKAGTVVST
jgi:hypothetical protein